ncbi:MAG: 50S ribosomal protein L18e [Candidatus Korarchaeota archaeon]
MRKIGPQLEETRKLIVLLEKTSKKNKSTLWKRVAEYLKGPRRNRAEINIGTLSSLTESNDIVIVPGKILGDGEITHPIKVAAYRISKSAYEKLTNAGGTILTIEQLIKENPSGTGIKLIV